ncbi:MAG: lysophospholipid acyltransferase family protein [Alphaproteobacteria bacterium]
MIVITAARSLLFAVFFYGGTIVAGTLFLPLLLVPRRVAMPFFRGWMHYSLACARVLLGIRYEVRLAPGASFPDETAIYAAKHQSAWETLAFNQIIRNPVFVLKKELLRVPFFGWHLKKIGHIPVDRSGAASAMREMIAASKGAVADHRNIVIYPQGTRVPPGKKMPYHPGVFALYRTLGTPVVPIALNSGVLWPRTGLLRRAGKITVLILPAIPPGLDRAAFMSRLEQDIEGACATLDVSKTACG